MVAGRLVSSPPLQQYRIKFHKQCFAKYQEKLEDVVAVFTDNDGKDLIKESSDIVDSETWVMSEMRAKIKAIKKLRQRQPLLLTKQLRIQNFIHYIYIGFMVIMIHFEINFSQLYMLVSFRLWRN